MDHNRKNLILIVVTFTFSSMWHYLHELFWFSTRSISLFFNCFRYELLMQKFVMLQLTNNNQGIYIPLCIAFSGNRSYNLKHRLCHLMLSKLYHFCSRLMCRGQQLIKPSPEFWHSLWNLQRARWTMTGRANRLRTRTAQHRPLRCQKEGLCSETWMTMLAWGRPCGIWTPNPHRRLPSVVM